jgi:phage shock protein A
MKWLQSFNLLVRSSVTTLKEKVEDPERMLHQPIIDMEEELDRVRESVAEAIADEIQLGRQVIRARKETCTWSERAEKCVRSDNDVTARQALEQKVAADQRVETLEHEHDEQKSQTAKLQNSVQELENKKSTDSPSRIPEENDRSPPNRPGIRHGVSHRAPDLRLGETREVPGHQK